MKAQAGRTIASARTKAGLSQVGLADLIGVSHTRVSRWESGGSIPKPEHLVALRRELSVDTAALVRSYWPDLLPEVDEVRSSADHALAAQVAVLTQVVADLSKRL